MCLFPFFCFPKLTTRNGVMNPVKWLLCWLDDVLCLGQSLNLRCNPILTRIFTFNFSAAVQLNPAGTKKKTFSWMIHKSPPYNTLTIL